MSEAVAHISGQDESALAALRRAAALLDSLPHRLRDPAACAGLARTLDTVLVRVARGRGALDLAIGDRLDALSLGDRALCLGYSGIGDYSREQLGIAASTARKMARLASRLRDRPLLREAVRNGQVSTRQAEAIVEVARGEAEEEWVARARRETVRALKAAVKQAGASETDDEEPFGRLCVDVAPEHRPVLDEAMEVAGAQLGATTPKWQRLEALCQEYLGGCGAGPEGGAPEPEGNAPIEDWMEPAKEWLEQESRRWAFLDQPGAAMVSEPIPDAHADERELHQDLLRLSGLRARWDETFGQLATMLQRTQAFRLLEFISLDHYAEERLGMCGRAVQQRASLEKRLHQLPSLLCALRERRVSYEQARLIARYADARDVDGWIEQAADLTCLALREALLREEEVKMCAKGSFEVVVPLRIRTLVSHAFDAVRAREGSWLSPGECLFRIAQHFLEVHQGTVPRPRTLSQKAIARDRGRCLVPGCSRAAAHGHHVLFRSAGGKNALPNLGSLCVAHHLRGVHLGRIRVRGTAPDGLTWELGVRPGMAPIAVYRPVAGRSVDQVP